MNELHGTRYGPIVAVLVGVVSACAAAQARANRYDVQLDISGVAATAIEQAAPEFPAGETRGGQEGWVRMSFVVDPDGNAVDPVILDSLGGAAFERAALDVVSRWQFQAPDAGAQSADNTVEVRFEISKDRDRASRDFLRRFRGIVSDLHYGKPGNAREKVDMANGFGGWNLYEWTMLALLNARVEAAEGDDAEELEYYRRALAVSSSATLDREERMEILGRIFELEVDSRHYGNALATLRRLRAEKDVDRALAERSDKIRQLENAIESDDAMTAEATIYNPCDCPAGTPLWVYAPVRREFSFAGVRGNVERFEARCDNHRLGAQVATGTRWSLPAEWGSCRIFVFGDDAATFELIEYAEDSGGADDGGTAVASSDVVD